METATLDDPVALARDLIRCPSVTPRDAGALDLLQSALEGLGLVCHRLPFGEDGGAKVDNLYARIGTAAPNLCFAGHTDVVPPGDLAAWSHDPFAAEMAKGRLFGRGATDMKGAVACFIAALARFLAARKGRLEGSVSLLITGDEEGPAVNGTVRVLEWLTQRGERLDACLVGEPTSVERLGDTVKIGRRGSLTGQITVHGVQGHTAYPNLADNPIPRLITMLSALMEKPLDAGSAHFQPSTLEVTTIDVGNPASNLIPAQARASFNIRYNDLHTGESLTQWLRQTLDTATGGAGAGFDLAIQVSGDAFLCPPGRLSQVVCDSIESVLKLRPELSTAGGTSDARFIHHHCPVAEFGLPGITMHKVDEGADLADLHALTKVYEGVLDRFFAGR